MEGRKEWKNKWSQGSSPKPNSNEKNTNSMSGLRFRRNQRENAPHSTSPPCRVYQQISTCSLAISTGCPGFHLWFIWWDYKPNYSATSWMGGWGGGRLHLSQHPLGFRSYPTLTPRSHPKGTSSHQSSPPLPHWIGTPPNSGCNPTYAVGRSPPSLWSPITLTHKGIPNQTHQAGSTLWDHKQLKKTQPKQNKTLGLLENTPTASSLSQLILNNEPTLQKCATLSTLQARLSLWCPFPFQD